MLDTPIVFLSTNSIYLPSWSDVVAEKCQFGEKENGWRSSINDKEIKSFTLATRDRFHSTDAL